MSVVIGDLKVWVRLSFSTLIAAVNSLRSVGKDMHDTARMQEHVGDERLSGHTRAEAEHVHAAAHEIEDEKHRVMHDGGTLDAAVAKEIKDHE